MLCWPLALLALVLYPIVWLLLLPFRIVGIAVDGVFELLRGISVLARPHFAWPASGVAAAARTISECTFNPGAISSRRERGWPADISRNI